MLFNSSRLYTQGVLCKVSLRACCLQIIVLHPIISASSVPLPLLVLPPFFFFFVIIWLHRAASCHSLHASSLFFLSSCIMPSVSGSSCRPQCTALLKWGLNEGGAQIIWKQRKTRHLKGPRKERVMNQSGLSELLKREFSVLKQKEHMDTKENLRRDSQ